MVKYRAVAVAVAVAVSGGGAVAVAVAVAGLTKRFFNHIQKNFLINIWGYFFSVRKKREILFRRSIKGQMALAHHSHLTRQVQVWCGSI